MIGIGSGSRQALGIIGNLPRCVVAMEACGGASHWERVLKVTDIDGERHNDSSASVAITP